MRISGKKIASAFPIYLCILGTFTNSVYIGGIGSFLVQKVVEKNFLKFTKILYYIKSSCIIFCTKMFGYSHFIDFITI